MPRRVTARKPRAWSERDRAPARPFTAEEDAELKAMRRCGLCVDYWHTALPDRRLGELLERNLQLIEAGELVPARPI